MSGKWYDSWPEWHEMSDEQKSAFIKESINQSHKREYEWALELTGASGPAWEDLTQEQRDNVGKQVRAYNQEMREFGKSLSQNNGAG